MLPLKNLARKELIARLFISSISVWIDVTCGIHDVYCAIWNKLLIDTLLCFLLLSNRSIFKTISIVLSNIVFVFSCILFLRTLPNTSVYCTAS